MHIDIHENDRTGLLELFCLADDSVAQVMKYLALGEILVARDGPEIIGHVQVIANGRPDISEMKSLAVVERRQGEGIGKLLVAAAAVHCRRRGASRLVTSTATADIGNLRFYQRRGFRMVRIVQDAFVESRGYAPGTMVDGIELRDQVILELDLNSSVRQAVPHDAALLTR